MLEGLLRLFLCLSLSFYLFLTPAVTILSVCWKCELLRASEVIWVKSEMLLCKDFVSSLHLQEGEISNKSFPCRWEGEISDLFWHSFITLASCQVCHLWTARAVFQVEDFFFFFLALLPVAHCSSLMSHLGLAMYFGTKVTHVLGGMTLSSMASNPIKCTLGETGLIMLLLQHAYMCPLCSAGYK